MTTVLTLDGFGWSGFLPFVMNGTLTAGKTVVPVPYNNNISDLANMIGAANTLNNKLHDIAGHKEIVCISMGAQVASMWLRVYGPTSDIDPSEVHFILLGNPERKYNGGTTVGAEVFGQPFLTGYGDVGIPEDTPYTVTDFARQYDGVADWPDQDDPSWMSIENAIAGLVLVHNNYFGVTLNDPDLLRLQEGNIEYVFSPTYPMPWVDALFPLSSPTDRLAQDAFRRPVVEGSYDRPFDIPQPSNASGIDTLERAQGIWDKVQARKLQAELDRLKAPVIRLWDGDMTLRGEVVGWRAHDFEFIENDTGAASIQLSLDHYLAKWVMNFKGRAKRNVIVTFDKQGARWSGFMDNYSVVREKGGDAYLEIVFKHDYEQSKHIVCWSNPFLRPEVQFPKLWVIFGPAKWCLLMTLFVNILRLETSLWTLPDNPLDINEWMPLSFNPSQWKNIVKPFPLILDNSNLTIVFSRFKTWHDVAKKTLEDAQLTVVCRRFLDGDPHPFSDLTGELNIDIVEDLFSIVPLRHGCLVWDIVDNSGWGTETAFGGSWLTGLVRAVVNIASDGTTEGVDIFTGDPTYPGEYYTPYFLGTSPAAPWIVFEEGPYTGIESSKFTYNEATSTSFVTGGHSMPGVNEGISAAVNMAGDFVTSLINSALAPSGAFGGAIDLPPLGGVMDAVAKIFYEDVFLAFMEIPTLRAIGLSLPLPGLEDIITGLGDFHYLEDWVDGADRAFTLSAIMAVRAKIWATRAHSSHTIKVADAAPYIFGEKGYGHFGIGARVGTTVLGFPTPDTIFVERLSKAKYAWDKDGPKGWDLTIGYREPQDPALKALDWIREINSGLGSLGVL